MAACVNQLENAMRTAELCCVLLFCALCTTLFSVRAELSRNFLRNMTDFLRSSVGNLAEPPAEFRIPTELVNGVPVGDIMLK